MTHYRWRAMNADDLSHVMEIAALVHAGYFEAREVFAERLALFPQGCRIAAHMTPAGTEEVIGYAFMHPTRHGQPPALNRLLLGLEEGADCLHLHDVALLPQARGSGLGRALVEEICQLGRTVGLRRATLVARPVACRCLENVFQRIGRAPVTCQSGISMSRLKSGRAKRDDCFADWH